MKITKFGHCCFLIEERGLRILTDPGDYTIEQSSITGIDVVLITHEHGDHLHMDSVKKLMGNNPQAKIFTNHSVGKLLEQEKLPYILLEHGQTTTEQGVLFEAIGNEHHIIYKTWPAPQNTGYFIGNKLFYPGDAFTDPKKVVDVLALPVNAPWLALAEALDYAQSIKPRVSFPVHDGNMKSTSAAYRVSTKVLGDAGVPFIPLELGKATEL